MTLHRVVPAVLLVVAVAIAAVRVDPVSAETIGNKWKWVDANDDCKSICDNTRYNCPCVIW